MWSVTSVKALESVWQRGFVCSVLEHKSVNPDRLKRALDNGTNVQITDFRVFSPNSRIFVASSFWRMKMVFSAKKSSECRTFGDSVCEFITYDKIQFSFFGFHYASLNLFTFSQFAYALAWARFLSRWLRVSWAKLAKISAVAILVFDSKRYLYLTVSYFFRWRSRTKQSENTNNSALEPIPTISQFRLFCSRFLSRFGS